MSCTLGILIISDSMPKTKAANSIGKLNFRSFERNHQTMKPAIINTDTITPVRPFSEKVKGVLTKKRIKYTGASMALAKTK